VVRWRYRSVEKLAVVSVNMTRVDVFCQDTLITCHTCCLLHAMLSLRYRCSCWHPSSSDPCSRVLQHLKRARLAGSLGSPRQHGKCFLIYQTDNDSAHSPQNQPRSVLRGHGAHHSQLVSNPTSQSRCSNLPAVLPVFALTLVQVWH
jgi:hypothetical protein